MANVDVGRFMFTGISDSQRRSDLGRFSIRNRKMYEDRLDEVLNKTKRALVTKFVETTVSGILADVEAEGKNSILDSYLSVEKINGYIDQGYKELPRLYALIPAAKTEMLRKFELLFFKREHGEIQDFIIGRNEKGTEYVFLVKK